MADEHEQNKEDVVLIAQVRAYLLSGDSIDLLPFHHEEDVRGEVNKFIEEWVKTGFLLKENFLYPWNEVRTVEVLSVEAVTHAQAAPYLEAWHKDSAAQKAFWKTRKPHGQKDDKKGDEPAH